LGAAFNIIGGTEPGEANLISGNIGSGISLNGPIGQGNMVTGNWVGTTINGNVALGNATGAHAAGIFVGISDAGTIVEGNLVSGNHEQGIALLGDYNFAIGNHIGTDVNLTSPVPNTAAGIYVRGEHNMVQGNITTYSLTGSGVEVDRWPYNTIRRNSIFSNAGQGISLVNGGNQTLPVPIITSVTPTSVAGTACPGCTVEVFSDAEDEGRVYEGSTVANVVGAFTFSQPAGLTGPYVTSTATDPVGNTSEFSAAQRVWRRIYMPAVLKRR
jgi:parallel beta-helix repeat protein